MLTQGSVSSWLGLVGGLKVVVLLLSETSEALFSIAPTATAYKATMIFNRRRPAAEFAIVFRQNSDGKEVSFDGFVLHKGKLFVFGVKKTVFIYSKNLLFVFG